MAGHVTCKLPGTAAANLVNIDSIDLSLPESPKTTVHDCIYAVLRCALQCSACRQASCNSAEQCTSQQTVDHTYADPSKGHWWTGCNIIIIIKGAQTCYKQRPRAHVIERCTTAQRAQLPPACMRHPHSLPPTNALPAVPCMHGAAQRPVQGHMHTTLLQLATIHCHCQGQTLVVHHTTLHMHVLEHSGAPQLQVLGALLHTHVPHTTLTAT
jgi:hypothetical protein